MPLTKRLKTLKLKTFNWFIANSCFFIVNIKSGWVISEGDPWRWNSFIAIIKYIAFDGAVIISSRWKNVITIPFGNEKAILARICLRWRSGSLYFWAPWLEKWSKWLICINLYFLFFSGVVFEEASFRSSFTVSWTDIIFLQISDMHVYSVSKTKIRLFFIFVFWDWFFAWFVIFMADIIDFLMLLLRKLVLFLLKVCHLSLLNLGWSPNPLWIPMWRHLIRFPKLRWQKFRRTALNILSTFPLAITITKTGINSSISFIRFNTTIHRSLITIHFHNKHTLFFPHNIVFLIIIFQ